MSGARATNMIYLIRNCAGSGVEGLAGCWRVAKAGAVGGLVRACGVRAWREAEIHLTLCISSTKSGVVELHVARTTSRIDTQSTLCVL